MKNKHWKNISYRTTEKKKHKNLHKPQDQTSEGISHVVTALFLILHLTSCYFPLTCRDTQVAEGDPDLNSLSCFRCAPTLQTRICNNVRGPIGKTRGEPSAPWRVFLRIKVGTLHQLWDSFESSWQRPGRLSPHWKDQTSGSIEKAYSYRHHVSTELENSYSKEGGRSHLLLWARHRDQNSVIRRRLRCCE